ncbi:Tex family protein [Selenomonas dianae]|uniref:Tex family protein n=1 Tax=Selenomonas dianae TaxID=135079 RepID=A0ABN0T9Q3_9FIRM|nr:Tex family protein [Selenomonas dianae]WLD81557.1 Tex family protein [Selenomonas dianae]
MRISDIPAAIAGELSIRPQQVASVITLLDDGNTIPFIARYRKEATGSLEDEMLRQVETRLTYLRSLVKRQEEIIARIEEQGKLTDDLRTAIEAAEKLQTLEDLYRPYKQKKRTRASIARERGLEALASTMLLQRETNGTPEETAAPYVNAEKGIPTVAEALAGARDILAETIMDEAELRRRMREKFWRSAVLETTLNAKAADAQVFQMYDGYSEPVRTLPSHRILAINRGEKKGCLTVRIAVDHEENIAWIYKRIYQRPSIFEAELHAAIEDGYKRLLLPALERELRTQLTETAEEKAIAIFGHNLRQLLLQPPLTGHTVLGLDPGYRTGCKVALVDTTGSVRASGVIQVTKSDGERKAAAQNLLNLIKTHHVTLISIGNGTASYETEQFVAALIRDNNLKDVHYLITNEAGASVYSASQLAKDELPDYDVTIRGAVSIARRVQDPLAELVKIDPQAIGVGQYQHDVSQKQLKETLDATVEDAVNHVGVDLNTASPALLNRIAGINAAIAKNIVAYRNEHGRFTSRKTLRKVARLGDVAFTQCAGFLRIYDGETPLDATAIHPESYELARAVLSELGITEDDLRDRTKLPALALKTAQTAPAPLAKKLSAGIPTVTDILKAIACPGRDPREDLPAPLTRQNIVKLSDLAVGTILKGTVRNITDFGAFIDIGLKQAGLLHISEMSHRRVRHPLDVLSVGDSLDVMIISIDEERGRIGLSLKRMEKEKARA